MARPPRNQNSSHLLVLVSAVVIIAALYFAKVVLVPFALAILFTFILATPVGWLERIRVPRLLAVLLMVLLAMGAIGSVGWIVTNQLVDATSQWPKYRTNIKSKIESIRKQRPQTLNDAAQAVQEISTDLNAATPAAPVPAPTSAKGAQAGKTPSPLTATAVKPVPVEIVTPGASFIESLPNILGPIGTAGIVLVFTIFMLLQREDLRNRFIRLAGDGRLSVMTQAMDEAGDRVSHYLFLQSMVNASYGLIIGFSLYLMHVPNAVLFGVIAGILRFLPYVGPPIGAFLPVMLSLAVFEDWTRPLMVLGIYVVIEVVVANFIEPMLYGSKTGISSIAVLVAAVFWTFLWGPIGLVLSTPLTVCLVVMGRHIPSMRFLSVLLGDDPVLTPEVHYYQRLLATDHDEARQVLRGHLKEKSLEELYDTVLIPALLMAEQDRHRNDLDEETATFIYQSTREFVEDLSEKSGKESSVRLFEFQPPNAPFGKSSGCDLRSRERRSRRNCRRDVGAVAEHGGTRCEMRFNWHCGRNAGASGTRAAGHHMYFGGSTAGADACAGNLRAIANAISVAADYCWTVELFRRRGEIGGENRYSGTRASFKDAGGSCAAGKDSNGIGRRERSNKPVAALRFAIPIKTKAPKGTRRS